MNECPLIAVASAEGVTGLVPRTQAAIRSDTETYAMVLGDDGRPRVEFLVAGQLRFDAADYALLTNKVHPILPTPPAPGNRAGK